jgi:hypothetical protein
MHEKPLGPHRPTGRRPTARLATSEPPLTRGWTVVWKGSRGSCKAMVKRIRDRVYGSVPAEAAVVNDPDDNRYLVIWRLPHERNDGTGTDDHVPGPDRA